MGWAVTRREIKCKSIIFSVWLTYAVVHCLLYVWKKTEIDVIEDIDEYQTVPGVLILFLRVLTMLTFLMSLRDTMLHETSEKRLNFFLVRTSLHFNLAVDQRSIYSRSILVPPR